LSTDQRRHGVGRALLGAALSEAESKGFTAVSLSVEPDNPSRVLYGQLGFVQVGIVEGSWTMRAELLKLPS
jgi:ribosomal protein S18 acetylase RimI-like enzyme